MCRVDFKRLLLAGVPLAISLASAQADELSSLKAELDQLQNRIQHLASPSPQPRDPDAAMVTVLRGPGRSSEWKTNRAGEPAPETGGFTLALTPAGDRPAPTHEVTISGYVKGDVIYDFDQDLGDFFSYTRIASVKNSTHTRLHARQSRFNIKSGSDTRIGQIRTLIEGDFMAGGSEGPAEFRLRHAWGEWDLTPHFTLGAGRYWQNFMSPFTGITTVDFNGDVGLIGRTRNDQVRFTWRDGPALAAMSLENPTAERGDLISAGAKAGTKAPGTSDNLPDLNVRMQYDIPGGHQLVVSGLLRNYHAESNGGRGGDDALGWGVQGAANIQLTEFALLSAGAMYGRGLGSYLLGPSFGAYVKDGNIELVEQLGLFAGITVNVTDATSINLGWGYSDQNDKEIAASRVENANVDVMSAHANIIWQPVEQLRLGAEVMWGRREFTTDNRGTDLTRDAWRGQLGAWFFF
ncbi:hypothetical protein FHS85_000603 [Rhodoligotrophos appendicifer]|uniref:DcaP family trimeric outer membrane transporter n=1 Tax=Rhodoligotrophos appendicifer TaxID=987056 RepID=UPI00117C285C|nr:DcaP family trimeric outer membrane transporter [Rhodoligotrophos appendicifer]